MTRKIMTAPLGDDKVIGHFSIMAFDDKMMK